MSDSSIRIASISNFIHLEKTIAAITVGIAPGGEKMAIDRAPISFDDGFSMIS